MKEIGQRPEGKPESSPGPVPRNPQCATAQLRDGTALDGFTHVLPQLSLFMLLCSQALGATVGKDCLLLSESAREPRLTSGARRQLAYACRMAE